jgi:hypothetical protein
MIVITILLLLAMLNPRIARAGVVIEQRITAGAPGAPGSVRNRTLVLQDDKEKFQIDDRVSVVIDANDRTVTMLDYGQKTFRELPLRVVIGTSLDPNRFLNMAFKSTGKTRELLGFKCRDYAGARYSGPLMAATTACFSPDAAGSDEFSHFMQSMFRRSGKSGGAISFPAGIPLIIESARGVNPSFGVPADVPKEDATRFKNRMAKIPPQITRVEVTKITSEKLSPDAFNTPAGYTRRGREPN